MVTEFKKGMILRANLNEKSKSNIRTSVQKGENRPGIIVSNNKFNRYSTTLQFIPLSTKIEKSSPVHVIVPIGCGVTEESIALVEQEQTIDKDILLLNEGIMGMCTKEVMRDIEKAILFQKGIETFDLGHAYFLITDLQEKEQMIKNLKEVYLKLKLQNLKKEILKLIESRKKVFEEFKWYCCENNVDYKRIYNMYFEEQNCLSKEA